MDCSYYISISILQSIMSDGSNNFTFTFTGKQSILNSTFFPPLELPKNNNFVIGLVDLYTYNSIPNIYSGCNKLYVGEKTFVIPDGSYEIDELEKYLREILTEDNITLSLKANNSTLTCEIKCSEKINFEKSDSIYRLLGFKNKILDANTIHISDEPIKILKSNALRIECNIIDCSYVNGKKSYTIHEFFPVVPAGYKIVEIPSEIIYLPIRSHIIDNIQIRIIDQDGDLIDFRGEDITVRLHLKSL